MYRTATGRELKLSGAANNWPGAADANGLRTGSQGNDVYFGGGKETLRGLGGDDVYNLFSASAVVDEAAEGGTDTVVSNLWGSTTLAANVENLFLQGAGSSVGIGNDLDNIIKAGATAATLYGAAGDDVLVGGAGGDVFRIVAGSGSEAVVSFQHGWDAISLEGYGIGSFAALQALTQQVGSDVQISFANGEILVMRDIDGATLSAADFNFLQGVERDAGSSYMGNPTNAYHGNGWYVLNNTWGSSQLKHGTDYLLESAFSKADLTGATAFSWSYPLTTNPYASVLAYPEVAFGHNPHGGGFNPNVTPGVFPACVADMLAFDVDYDVAIAGNLSGFNVAYDIWFTGKPYGTAADVTTELMIWVHKGSANAFGSLVGRYTDGTFSANIYRSGTYVALVADADCLSGTLRVGAIVAYLVELGIMSTSEYLASIELGSEVFSGSGSLLINNFDFTLTQTTATGQISTAAVTGAGTTITETPPPSAGNDIYDLADRFDTIRDAGGTDTIISTIGRDLNDYPDIENLTLTGTADINATGNKWANVLIGNDGDNILDGGPGADILKGGLGNDTYVLAGATNDTLTDTGGVDTITSTISRDLRNYSGIENLTLTFSAHVDAIGNQADNVLQGNSGKNLLQGLGGNDTLHG
ncbi:MAG: hypothetical protein JWR39_1184, partial [Devosia sp.]|nr:hypothetical protein [Devosia sp.]